MSVVSVILSFLGITYLIGMVLAIIDLCEKDGRKKGLSIVSVALDGIWTIVLLIFLGSSLAGAGTGIENTVPAPYAVQKSDAKAEAATNSPSDKLAKWAVYIYMCGSDLESDNGMATYNLSNILDADISDNVYVVVETGGTLMWQNESINPDVTERFLINSEGMNLIDRQPLHNMGAAASLRDFMEYSITNYPAEHSMLLLWDHGNGSVGGSCMDENFNYDSLSVAELRNAFSDLFGDSPAESTFDIVGFDACLMANIDTADALADYADYLIASEENEPGIGWDYEEMIDSLSQDEDISALEFGRFICDTFYEENEAFDTADSVTLSLIDLDKIDEVVKAYDEFGSQILEKVYENPGYYSEYARIAERALSFGSNSWEYGYTNMIDMKNVAERAAGTFDSADDLIRAIDDSVVYLIAGSHVRDAGGISCYYSFNGDRSELNNYLMLGCGTSFKQLYSIGIKGIPYDDSLTIASAKIDYDNFPSVPNLDVTDWEDKPFNFDHRFARLILGTSAKDILAQIKYNLFLFDEDSNALLFLGSDDEIDCNWDAGIFTDIYSGYWGYLNEIPVYMELTYQSDDYNLYSVPVLINDDEYELHIIYDYETDEWSIGPAVVPSDEGGIPTRETYILKPGDTVDVLCYSSSFSDDDELETYIFDTFIYSSRTEFSYEPLPYGIYGMCYEMTDTVGNSALSDIILFEIEDENMYYINEP